VEPSSGKQVSKGDIMKRTLSILIPILIIISTYTVPAVEFEGQYGILSVWPDTSNNAIRQLQYYNATSYLPSQELDIIFRFPFQLTYGSVHYWDGSNYNKVSNIDHIEYNGYHWYILSNIHFNQYETKHGYWEYDVPINTSGKWDMFLKRSSDTLQDAYTSGHYVHLDPWWNSSFTYSKLITIDHTQVPQTLTNFPVCINITDADLASFAQADGDDICFITYDNTTQYHHEIEYFDSLDGVLIAWVNITTLSHLSDTNFWMYFGNSTCSNQQNVSGTWNSDYVMVHHLHGADLAATDDSTSNSNDATNSGGTPQYEQPGVIHYGILLDGDSSEYISISDSNSLDVSPDVTMSCWYRWTETAFLAGLFGKWDTGYGKRAYCILFDGGAKSVGAISEIGSGSYSQTATNVTDTDWNWVSASFDHTTKIVTMIENGIKDNFDITDKDATDIYNSDQPFYIGCQSSSGNPFRFFYGYIDELRVSDCERSEAWQIAEYNSMVNATNGSFFTVHGLNTYSSSSDDNDTNATISGIRDDSWLVAIMIIIFGSLYIEIRKKK